MPGDENKNIPVNPYIIYHMELIPQTKEYWETKNPIIPRMKAALDTDSNTYRVGDGETHYLDLEPRPYIAGGGGWEFELATETEPGAVSNLASESDVDSATGPGAVQAKHLAIVYDKVKGWMISDKQIAANVGDRFLKPWKSPKPGYKVLNGQYIETSDVSYGILKQYLVLNPDEVITSTEYETKLAAAGGVGGVHFYALYADGRIRLPDLRGDYWEGSGFDGRDALDWSPDQMRPISGYIAAISRFTQTIAGVHGAINAVDANDGFSHADGILKSYDYNLDTTLLGENYDGNVTKPRSVSYLPVVYVGVGQEWISENGQIFLATTRSKNIGEVFWYDGTGDPVGGLWFDGRLVSRTTYGPLFQHVVANNKIKTEAEWQAAFASSGGNVDFYSYSDDETMFRLPVYDLNDRNWLTESLMCVQAYHAIPQPAGELNLDAFADLVAAKIMSQVATKQVGEVFYYIGTTDPDKSLIFDGRKVQRAKYSLLFNHVVAVNQIRTEEEWQTAFTQFGGNVDFYSYSDDEAMFRLPTYNPDDRNWFTDSVICVYAGQ